MTSTNICFELSLFYFIYVCLFLSNLMRLENYLCVCVIICPINFCFPVAKLIRYQKTRVHKIFQVGAKCHVKLRKSENDLYTCHIQEIAVDKGYCIVFIEQLGEKRLVSNYCYSILYAIRRLT